MSTRDGNSRQVQYDRLKRRLDRFTPALEYAKLLKEAADEILADNPIGSEGSSDEIGESIKALLPPPQTVFTREYFSQPVFPVTLIKGVATLYGCLQVDELILQEVDDEKKADSVAMTNVWLAHVYNPTLERVLLVLDMYETARIFGQQALNMPLTPRKEKETLGMNTQAAPLPSPIRAPVPGPTPTAVPGPTPTAVPITIPAHGTGVVPDVAHTRTERQHKDVQGQENGSDADQAGRSQTFPKHTDYPRHIGDQTKKAAAVEQYFRSTKYNGDLTQSLQSTIRDYNVCAMQLELSPRQKALFFINVFGGTARDYFFEHCRDNMSYEQLVDVMKKGFDNNARQLAIEAELESLTLEKVMKDNNITDINQGLTKLADKISSLFPQMPMQSQYPKNKVRFLRKAVLEQDWAKASIAQIVTADFGFDDLLTSLREQYQLEREVQEAKSKSGSALSTLYQQYGRKPSRFNRVDRRGFRPGKPGQKRLNPIGRDGKRMACSLCGSLEHFARNCPPGAPRNYVRSKLERGVSAVHICHDLLKGIEALASEISSDNDDDEPAQNDNGSSTDAPSELHIFDQLSSEDVQEDETTEFEPAETGFFDEIDEGIAVNFIASKFAEKDTVPSPQPITPANLQSGFQEDV